jgi:hypothetical protein
VPGAAAALVLLAACTSGGSPAPGVSGGPTYHPRGQIVVLAGRFLSRISVLDAATGKEQQLRLPFFGGAYDNAWPSPDGRFYAMPLAFSGNQLNQLFLLGGGKRPERIGPPVRGVGGYQVTAGYALAWACPGVMRLLDLATPTAWRTIGHGCSGSISPDGSRIAYATPSALFVMDLPDGTPREVLRFRDLPELRRAHVPPQSLDSMLWGEPGVAMQVGDASRDAIVVWREGSPPIVDPVGTARLGQMRWQPGGRLLAFYDSLTQGEVLTLDGDTGEERQIAASSDFDRLAWSPDGRVVAASRSENVVALMDPAGSGQRGTLVTSGVPLIWLPPAPAPGKGG